MCAALTGPPNETAGPVSVARRVAGPCYYCRVMNSWPPRPPPIDPVRGRRCPALPLLLLLLSSLNSILLFQLSPGATQWWSWLKTRASLRKEGLRRIMYRVWGRLYESEYNIVFGRYTPAHTSAFDKTATGTTVRSPLAFPRVTYRPLLYTLGMNTRTRTTAYRPEGMKTFCFTFSAWTHRHRFQKLSIISNVNTYTYTHMYMLIYIYIYI